MRNSYIKPIGVIAGAMFVVLGMGYWFTDTHSAWYRMLTLPSFLPPHLYCGVMGCVVMLCWSASATRLYISCHPQRGKLLTLYGIHALCVMFWPFMLFQLHSPTATFINQVALLSTGAGMAYRAWRIEHLSAGLLAPLLLWETFMLAVSYMLVMLN